MENQVIRVLHFVPNLNSGGTETFIMNMYRNIDRAKVQFDFIVHTNEVGVFEKEIKDLGGKIFRFPIKDDKNFFKYIKCLNLFFKKHPEYKIVHGAMPSIGFIYLKIAQKNNVPVRIAHSHSASNNKNIKGFIKCCTSKKMKRYSTLNFACSKLAGDYLFGKEKYEIIHNAINVQKFVYNEKMRNKIRNEYNISENTIVLGHVGRFSVEKNQKFIIDVAENLDSRKYVLFLIGSGELENKIKYYVKEKGLNNNVIFTGNINNVNEYLQAFDVFLLPSLYEGLPTVAVEAQISGLPCIISNSVTNEIIKSNNSILLDVNKKNWLEQIKNTKINCNRSVINNELLEDYNILIESKKLEKIYIEKYEEVA